MKLEKEGLVVTPLTEQKTGLWDMAFIWFCANVAVPRLMIGGSLAELGFGKMILILIAGNILVFLPLLALGVIGFNVRIPTMAATRMTFGVKGLRCAFHSLAAACFRSAAGYSHSCFRHSHHQELRLEQHHQLPTRCRHRSACRS